MYSIVSDLSARTQKALQFILQERARLDLHCAVSTRENNSKSYIYIYMQNINKNNRLEFVYLLYILLYVSISAAERNAHHSSQLC